MDPIQNEEWRKKAQKRLDNNKRLKVYEGIIFSDWPEEDHFEWVATAPEEEIIDWATKMFKEQEEEAAYCFVTEE